jgi:Cytochrome C oxidase, mono-heme subunit/FixO
VSDLAAAAAALGVPEAIVQRSAAARATETGMTADEVLALWAGGGSAPAAPAPAPAAADDEPAPDTAPAPAEPAAPVPASAPLPAAEPTGPMETPAPAVAAAPGRPPILVGEEDHPMSVFVGVVGLFIALLLVGLIGPSIQSDNPGARTSAIVFTDSGLRGREIYANLGCASCHTQMVRPITSDVGLGAVTLNDSNQILGTRRFGPDLSNVGSRVTPGQLSAIVEGLGDHPRLSLSEDDLTDLTAYLSESTTLAESDGTDETEAGS